MKKNEKEQSLVLRKDVYQSNPLIQARKDFDIIGMRIFLLGLRALNPHFSENDKYFDVNFKETFIPTSKLTELFGGNTWYLHDLEKICDKMFDTKIKIRPEDGGFELYHLFRKLKYVKNEGLYIWFEELLRPYILDLFKSKGYTRINVEYLFKLSSPYAVRLLELLLQYQNIKKFKILKEIKRTFKVEELRFALNVPENAYRDRMNNFRKFVLDDPIKEINARTPYIVRYETIKDGRKVFAFEFVMDTYNVPQDEDNQSNKPLENNDALHLLCSLGFSDRAAQEIFKKCSDVKDCITRVNRAECLLARQRTPVKSKLGFLRRAIEENWQTDGQPPKNPNTDSQITDPNQEQPKRISKNLRVGRKVIPYTMVRTYIDAIRMNEYLDLVKEGLKEYNVSIERFVSLCEKHGI